MKNELYKLSAVDLLSMYKTRKTNPLEVSLEIIRQLENKNSQYNAFVCFDKEKILQQAKLSSERWSSGKVKGILDGVPISIKDLLVTKDYPTRRGSFIESLPITSDKDAPVVKKILEQGGIVLGKTTTPEFGHKGTTQSKRYGATLNPWNTELNSGGSSGGSASAVAAGMGPLSIGTDGGGSVRIPCSFCGLFGHKPTFGRVPAYPISPFGTVANIGPITRTVEDGGLLMNVIAKPDKDDWYSLPYDKVNYNEFDFNDIKNLKINYIKILTCFNPVIPHFVNECLFDLKLKVELKWPTFDKDVLDKENIKYVIQINGKKRSILNNKKDISERDLLEIVKKDKMLVKYLTNKSFKKIIFVKNRLINILIDE